MRGGRRGQRGAGRSSRFHGVTLLRNARNRQWQAQLWAGNGWVRLLACAIKLSETLCEHGTHLRLPGRRGHLINHACWHQQPRRMRCWHLGRAAWQPGQRMQPLASMLKVPKLIKASRGWAAEC